MLVLPEKILFTDYRGNFKAFLSDVYAVFKRDFVDDAPTYMGMRVGLKKYPLELDGKEHTFYHITHEGQDEANRIPSIARMECIPYPRFFIDNITHPDLLVWKNIRKSEERILIYHKEQRYLVVLAYRKTYVLLWTAYVADQDHTHRKLLKEYEAYKKARTA